MAKIHQTRKSHKSFRVSKRKGSRGGKIYIKPKGMTCKEFLGHKIAHNMREFKKGKRLSNGRRISSRRQAIAMAYSQVRKAGCRI